MDRLLYVSTVGLGNIDLAQTTHAHNLANVSTVGFKADLARVMPAEVGGMGYRTRVYGVNDNEGVDLSHGALQQTDRDLDLAIAGDGYLTVELPDGREGYTRAGGLQIDAAGRLLSARGFPVVGQGGPIALPPHESLVFGADGSITVKPEGQGGEALVQVDRLKLVNPDAARLTKDPTGLLVIPDEPVAAPDDSVRVTSGFLESSNVNAIHELTEIISLARQFELEVRMMRTAQENSETASQLLRIG